MARDSKVKATPQELPRKKKRRESLTEKEPIETQFDDDVDGESSFDQHT